MVAHGRRAQTHTKPEGAPPWLQSTTKETVMKTRNRSYVRYIVAAVITFAVGLAIGAWQGNAETVLNEVSAVLLTVGVLAFVVISVLEVVRRRRLA